MTGNAVRPDLAAKPREEEAAPRKPLPSWMITTASVIFVLGAWELFGRDVNPVLGSHPTAIIAAAWHLAQSGSLFTALGQSLQAFVLGYVLAVIVGIPLGLLIGRFRFLESAIGIYIIGGYAMPLIALVPFLVLWFGLGLLVKVAVVFLMSVFPVCINTWLGVRNVPNSLIEVGKSLVASDAVILRRIILPATFPYIVAGIKLAVGRAVVAMVIAEFFTAISGLGGIIINSANSFDTATMFVPVFILMIMATLLNGAVGWIEKRVAPWQSELSGRG